MKPTRQALEEHVPWLPAKYELADVTAIQALSRGEADKHQQGLVMKWLIENAAMTYELSYRGGDGDRDTAFAEGRRFVGLQIVKMLKLNVSTLRRNDELPKA